MTATTPVAIGVEVERLGKRFTHAVKGEVHAARDVSLKVAPGEFLTLLGPSGCGKTTTLRMIAGFEMPDSGRIVFGGQDVTHLPANQRGIGFVFQNYALFPHLSVFENVAYGLRVRRQASDAISAAVSAVLRLVGLAGYESQFPAQMSGGEQQRVALARAIVIRPRVLLFDEPLSNLDAKLRVQMRDEIRALQQRLAITAIYVTHDQEEAMAVSDRIAVMQGGTIVQTGTAEDLYHRPATRFVAQFIGRANLVAARVEHVAGDQVEVMALGRRVTLEHPGAGWAAGMAARLLLRPESIALGRVQDAASEITANVVARTFLGEKIEYIIDCGGETLQVARHNAGPDDLFPVERRVAIRFADHAAILLPDDKTGAPTP
jgi:ABC-type Fe3+/spermidine/putrescine transport system ATPase subunit